MKIQFRSDETEAALLPTVKLCLFGSVCATCSLSSVCFCLFSSSPSSSSSLCRSPECEKVTEAHMGFVAPPPVVIQFILSCPTDAVPVKFLILFFLLIFKEVCLSCTVYPMAIIIINLWCPVDRRFLLFFTLHELSVLQLCSVGSQSVHIWDLDNKRLTNNQIVECVGVFFLSLQMMQVKDAEVVSTESCCEIHVSWLNLGKLEAIIVSLLKMLGFYYVE